MDTPPPIQPQQQAVTPDATGGVIPYKNVPALVGYYLGVFSLIPLAGAILGPAALITGIIGFRAYLREPKKRGQVHAWVAIILGFLSTCAHIAGAILIISNT